MSQYIYPLIGGFMIGIAALMLLALNGRMAGISGIINNAVIKRESGHWRWYFLVGLVLGPALLPPALQLDLNMSELSWPILILGGLLVGFGSAYGSGCTSGHGICGMGRLSPRSVVSVVTFMATAAIVVALIRHVIGGGL